MGGAVSIEERLAHALMRELDEHGYEDDDEKRGQVAHHFAAVLVAELGLTQEWISRHESGGGRVFDNAKEGRQFLAEFVERPPGVEDPGSGRYVGLQRRYVTNWEPAL